MITGKSGLNFHSCKKENPSDAREDPVPVLIFRPGPYDTGSERKPFYCNRSMVNECLPDGARGPGKTTGITRPVMVKGIFNK